MNKQDCIQACQDVVRICFDCTSMMMHNAALHQKCIDACKMCAASCEMCISDLSGDANSANACRMAADSCMICVEELENAAEQCSHCKDTCQQCSEACGQCAECVTNSKAISARNIPNKKAIVIFGSEIDLGGAGVPMEYDLLIEGAKYAKAKDVNGNNQPFTITASHIDSAVRQFAQRKQRAPMRDLVVDYEHQTLKGGEAPAAGWINNLTSIVRDGKKVLRAHMREWTDKATQYLQNHEYKYTSPVFALNASDKVTGEVYPCMIFNAALTNEPLIDELQPIAASQLYQTIFGKDTSMDGVIKKLCAFLNIGENADEQTVAAKFAEFTANVKTALAATTEIAAKDVLEYIAGAKTEIAAKADLVKVICAKDGGSVQEATAIYVAAKENAATVQTLHNEIDALKNKEINAQVDAIIAKGVTDGKITPATKEFMHAFAAKDIKAFETYLASAPVVLPIGKLPEGGDIISAKAETPEEVEMGKKLGVTSEMRKRYDKKE